MEPITTVVVTAFAIDKIRDGVVDTAKEWIKSNIFAGEAEHRLRKFVGLLIRESALPLSEKPTETEIHEALSALLNTEPRRQAVLEAYKRVCLSASKDIGPRIIALITARRLALGDLTTSLEEQYTLCAEQLSDKALLDFATSMRKEMTRSTWRNEMLAKLNPGSIVELDLYRIDTAKDKALSDVPGIRDAAANMGTWVHRGKSLGLLSEELKQTVISGGSFAGNDSEVSKFTYRLFCTSEFIEFVELIEKANIPQA